MSGLYLALGLAGVVSFVIWLGMRASKQVGIEQAHNETLREGAKTDAKTQAILARPPADKSAIVDFLRGDGK